jgi:acetyl esterase/lipase
MSLRTLSTIIVASAVVWLVGSTAAADRPAKPLLLWPNGAPGALGKEEKDIPTLTPYWPEAARATGASFVVCPGGGYNVLAPHEGEAYARWLNDLGIAAFVLKYRLVKDGYHLPVIEQDAARAVRLVRASATEWSLDPKRIGIIGSSAGGHLSATLITRFDAGRSDASDPIEQVSSRPDLAVLCYAFILFDRNDRPERQERFLGPMRTSEQVRRYSPALNVTASTPPCFVWQTVEDSSVVVENALVFADALRRAGVAFDLHLYQKGRHGIGLGTKDFNPAKLHPWTKACAQWLGEQGFLKPERS